MEILHRGPRPADKRAAEGNRTLDLVLTKDALYRLSYSSLWFPVFSLDAKAMAGRAMLAPLP